MTEHAAVAPHRMGGQADNRYVTLDGMRGIAALAVALFHFDFIRAPHGYIAVDFFFALSGFVLWRAYHARWKAGGYGAWAFMRQRAIRLYPLFLLGILLCTATKLGEMVGDEWNRAAVERMFYSLPTNLLMLPSPVSQALFPINMPAWTLFFELVASLFMVTVMFRLPRLGLFVICLLSAWVLVPVIAERHNANIGALWDEWGAALARTGFSFSLGAIIASLTRPRERDESWIAAAALLAIAWLLGLFVGFGLGFSIPVKRPEVGWYDLTCILLLWPMLLLVGSRHEVPRALVAPSRFLGEVSFALYAVHWALIEPFRWLMDDVGVPPLISAALYVGTALAISACAVKWFDEPLRRRLSAMTARARSASFSAGSA